MAFNQMVPAVAIKDHDMVYWIGDLNYRITDLDLDLVKENIRQNKLEDLYQADQLRHQIYRFELFVFFGFPLLVPCTQVGLDNLKTSL